MISLVTGKQRSGKSFYVMMLIVYTLRFSRRPICTNLPIYPDKLAYFASLGWKGQNKVKYNEYLHRFQIYCPKWERQDLKKFIKDSPDFWLLKKKGKKHPNILSTDPELLQFWEHTPNGSVIFIDEVYQFFSSMDFKDISDRRRHLLAYTRQHGHYKDDLYLISHNMADIDIHVRRGIQYKYEVVNMKYKNIVPPETHLIGPFLRGLKCPIQYFDIYGFEYGEDVASDFFTVYPDKRIFGCYDSHSKAETLNKQMSPEQYSDDGGSDVGVNFWYNFKRFLIQFLPRLVVIFGVLVGCYFAYVEYKKLGSSGGVTVDNAKNENIYSKFLYKMKDKIKLSDGLIIKKGDSYEKFTIVDFDSKFITLQSASGKQQKVELGKFRRIKAVD